MSDMMNMPMHQSHYDMLCSMVPGLEKIPKDQQMGHAMGYLKACMGGGRMGMSNEGAATGVIEASGVEGGEPLPTFRIPTLDDAEDAFSAIESTLASAPILSGDKDGRTLLATILTRDEKGVVSIGMAKRPGSKRFSILVANAIAAITPPESTVGTVHAGLFGRSTGGRTAAQGSVVPKDDVNVAAENQKVLDGISADLAKRNLDEANRLRKLRGQPAISA